MELAVTVLGVSRDWLVHGHRKAERGTGQKNFGLPGGPRCLTCPSFLVYWDQ